MLYPPVRARFHPQNKTGVVGVRLECRRVGGRLRFEKLEDPPACEPTHCGGCGRVIVLSQESHTQGPDGYRCDDWA